MSDDGATLLVADDDPGLRESLQRTLARAGHRVVLASDGRAALEQLQVGGVDLVLTDLKMPGLTGLELLRAAKEIAPDVDVILLTAFGTVEEAVSAMKDGAYDFITKPFRGEQLLKVVGKALERRSLIEQNRALQKQLEDLRSKNAMIGASPAFRRMMMLVDQVADSSATVLIQGESGAGKEGVARAIHERSGRRNGPFVAVNCAAIPRDLFESELFGHARGAYSGASSAKPGLLEQAADGTLLLDEIGDMPLELQAKLLRVLDDGIVRRVGEIQEHRVQVKIVAATNQPLLQRIEASRFRRDLYHRLAVHHVHVKPLRERPGDVELLARRPDGTFPTDTARGFRMIPTVGQRVLFSPLRTWSTNCRRTRLTCWWPTRSLLRSSCCPNCAPILISTRAIYSTAQRKARDSRAS